MVGDRWQRQYQCGGDGVPASVPSGDVMEREDEEGDKMKKENTIFNKYLWRN